MPHDWISRPDSRRRGGGPRPMPPALRHAPPPDAEILAELHLWPYRSLPKRGFVTFIGITLGLVSLPLLAVLGSPVLWALLPFIGGAIGAIWWALMRSYRDGTVIEVLQLSPGKLRLTRYNPRGTKQYWEADPYWVRLSVDPESGPVPHYLTLHGGGREVEIGAFLPEEERIEIAEELQALLVQSRDG